jgi:hypothetical protein
MKSKNIVLITVCLFIIKLSDAQNWQWSRQIGGNDMEFNPRFCIDQNNNIYVADLYWSDTCYTNGDTVHANGASDFFIAKYDDSGNEIWVKNFGGFNATVMQGEGIGSIVYDSISNTINFSGSFYGSCNFDSFSLVGSGGSDAYIAQMDLNGNIIWVEKFGGPGDDGCPAMNVDETGNIYAELVLSNGVFIDSVLVPSGIYLAKFDTNGNRKWKAKKINPGGSSFGYDGFFLRIKVKNGNIFAIGQSFVQSLTIDTVSCTIQFPNGQSLIACFDTNGTAKWIKPCGGELNSARDLTLDNDCNIYFTGYFDQVAIFENDTLHNAVQDLFLAKYDSSGSKIWVLQIFASSGAGGTGICNVVDGGIYLTGLFLGSASFGSFNVTSTANGDMCLARYDENGGCVGIRHLGQAGGSDVITDNSSNVFASGIFYNTVNFDFNPALTSYGQSDIYIAKSGAITGIGGEGRVANNQLIIYANPNKGTCNVTIPDEFQHEKNLTLQIFDNTGKLLQQTKVEMMQEKIKVNLEEEAMGIYNVTLSNGKKSYNGKIVFE